MNICDKIRNKRLLLGVSLEEISEQAELSLHSYLDIEIHTYEFFEYISLRQARVICKILDLDIRALVFESTCIEQRLSATEIPQIIRERRASLGLNIAECSERINFTDDGLQEIESNPDFFETICLSDILTLAQVLNFDPCLFI